MINEDTIYLLRECNSGTQMAVYSLDEVLEKVKDETLKELLSTSKNQHEVLGNKLHTLLIQLGEDIKEPNAMAKGMSFMKTNVKLAMEDSDRVCADLITDGCHMGTKSLQRYLNQYAAADTQVQDYAKELIQMEETLVNDLKPYL